MNISKKKLSLFIVILFILVLSLSGTFAWQSISQETLNEAKSKNKEPIVELDKLEHVTNKPISDVGFLLFKKDGSQVGGLLTTNSKGKINISLPIGEYYFQEWNSDYYHAIDKSKNKYPFIVSKEDITNKKTVNVLVYNSRLRGSLIIEKKVVGQDQELEKEFNFIVEFDDDNNYSYYIDGESKERNLIDKTLTLKNGQRAVFKDIPVGVMYKVVEKTVDGYYIESNQHTGHISSSGVLVEFKNIVKYGSLEINKSVIIDDNSVYNGNQEFSFVISFDRDGEYRYTIFDEKGKIVKDNDKISKTGIITLKNKQKAIFTNLPDNINYSVVENPINNYRAVYKEYSGSVLSGYKRILNFENHFGKETDKMGKLIIEKQVVNDNKDLLSEFEFKINFSDGEKYSYYIEDGDKVKSEELKLSDNHKFKLLPGQRAIFSNIPKGVEYVVNEIEKTGYYSLLKEIKGVINGNSEAKVLFENVRLLNGSLVIHKSINGVPLDGVTNRKFEFIVTFNDDNEHEYDLYDANDNVIGNGKIKISGSILLEKDQRVKFSKLPKGLVYEVSEKSCSDNKCYLVIKNGMGTIVDKDIIVEAINNYPGTYISGIKTWDIGNNKEVKIPDYIWIRLYNDNKLINRIKVFPDDKGIWKYSFIVPKYDDKGKEIIYRVEEEKVLGFRALYDKGTYNILNRYEPPKTPNKPTPPNKPTVPNKDIPYTDDKRDINFWIIFGSMSLIGLVICMRYISVVEKYRKRK